MTAAGSTPQGYPPAGAPGPAHPVWTPPPLPPPPPLPVEEREYAEFLRTPAYAPWRPVVALALAVVAFTVASVLQVIPLIVDAVRGRVDMTDLARGHLTMTPALLAFVGLGMALMIPVSWGVQRIAFGQPARWLHSVEGRFRWRWFGLGLVVVAAFWIPWLVIPTVLSRESWHTPTDVWAYLLISVLVIPFQSAGEEYLFRGLVNRSIASWFSHRGAGLVVGALVSSLLFMLVHGAGDLWLNLYYFGLGLVLCALCWRTGGLEASIALHVVNNVVSFVLATLTGNMGDSLDRSAGVGHPAILVSLLFAVAVLLILDRWREVADRRGRGVQRTAAPGRALIAGQPSVPTAAPRVWTPPVG